MEQQQAAVGVLSDLDLEEGDEVIADDLTALQTQPDTDFDVELDEQDEPLEIPDVVRNFVKYFHTNVHNKNVYEILSIYETSFNKLTDRFYKDSSWPPAEAVQTVINQDGGSCAAEDVFLVLYKELYYRHLYSRLSPNLDQRVGSYQNYCTLFNYLLSDHAELELPNLWLWDIVDEFIYQFQSFCQYRSKLENKTADELAKLKADPDLWSVTSVLNYLHCFVTKSNIVSSLSKESQGVTDEQENTRPLYKMLGYFSLIGLCRMHCLMGDYYLALDTLSPIDLTRKGLFARVTACHISLYYYMGFAYLMMRRYVDAIKTFSNILLYISRTKQYQNKQNPQYDQTTKKNEQMYALLAIAISLCPQRVDENVHSNLRERQGDKMARMQRGDEPTFKELFSFACPKFINPAPPNYDEAPMNYNQEAMRLQLKLFLNEVRQQSLLPTVRSYLKLYTTIPTSKLAAFMEIDEKVLRTQLLCAKHKTFQKVWNGGPPLSGNLVSTSDVEFYVDQDMIHIANTKVSRRYAEFFIRHINKFDAMIQAVSSAQQAEN